jgi:pimeloyl-ACP methyl ester carboxylesterase
VDGTFSSYGARLRYLEQGDGEAVVLLHGLLGTVELHWIDGYAGMNPNVVPALARSYRVLAVDLRGHGRSDKPHAVADYGARMADDVIALLDHTGISRAHVVGYSLGSIVAAKVACDHADRVGRVVLGGGSPYVPGDHPNGLSPELDRVVTALEQGRGLADYIIETTPGGMPRDKAELVSEYILAAQDVDALIALLHGIPELGVTDAQLATNRVPMLALIGALDTGLPELKATAPRVANLTVEVMPGVDHGTGFARPEFLRGVERFLAS